MERVWREFFRKNPPARAVLRLLAESVVVASRNGGNRLYLSGFVGADVATGRIPPDPDAQVQLALDNMKLTLAAAGMDFRHVVFVNP